jgi:hypothetical protein
MYMKYVIYVIRLLMLVTREEKKAENNKQTPNNT